MDYLGERGPSFCSVEGDMSILKFLFSIISPPPRNAARNSLFNGKFSVFRKQWNFRADELKSVLRISNPLRLTEMQTPPLQRFYKDGCHGRAVMCFIVQSARFLVTEPVVRRVMQSQCSTNDTAFFSS